MRTKPEAGEALILSWGADSEPARKDKPSGRNGVPPHREGATLAAGEAVEQCERPRCWEDIIGKICSFSPEPNNHGTRYCGAVLNVSEAPDFAGLPTCLATVRGRSGKTLVIDFTRCYSQIHSTWKEAEQ